LQYGNGDHHKINEQLFTLLKTGDVKRFLIKIGERFTFGSFLKFLKGHDTQTRRKR